MDRLKNKAALITGAGAGIGAATARLFCAQGARVCLLDANPQALKDTQTKLQAEFPQASVHTAQANIADEAQAQAAVQTAVAAPMPAPAPEIKAALFCKRSMVNPPWSR